MPIYGTARTRQEMFVAAGLWPAVEGGILPPGKRAGINHIVQIIPNGPDWREVLSAGLEARLHVRQDARRYGTERTRQKLFVVASGVFVNTMGP